MLNHLSWGLQLIMPLSIQFERTMNTLLGAGFFLWLCLEIPLSLRRRVKGGEADHRDKNTLSAIWITLVVGNFASLIIACFGIWPISKDVHFVGIGVMVFLAGVSLRLASIVALGRLFTYNVAIRDGHTLKTDGLYRFLRHPGYAGLLIAFIGINLAFNSWASFTIGVVPVFIVLAKRIDIEEEALINRFGDVYAQYRNRTYRMIPGIY